MTIDRYLDCYLDALNGTLAEIDRSGLERVAELFEQARRDRRQILLIGNGGSAATASHMACDLGKGTVDQADPSFRRYRVASLADNNALMTAVGNDISFEEVFTEQLRIVMQPRDLVLLISASGNSPNLVKAATVARQLGGTSIGLLGFGGGKLASLVDHAIVVSSRNYGIAEDFHLIFQHVLTQFLKRLLAGEARPVAFLDRDGIINERAAPHQYVRDWGGFQFRPGAIALLRGLQERGYPLIVVTNQQGVGKGVMTIAALQDVHQRMTAALSEAGVVLAGIFSCTHLVSDNCHCRKPRPGLIRRAVTESPFLIDLPSSVFVGDSPTDMEAGRQAGVGRLVLVSASNDIGESMQDVRLVPGLDEALSAVGSWPD